MIDLPLGERRAAPRTSVGPPRPQHPKPQRRRPLRPIWLLLIAAVLLGAAYWIWWRPPVAAANVERLVFDGVRVGSGTPASSTLELVNHGRRAWEVALLEIVGENGPEFVIEDDGCSGARLRAEESCQLGFSFAPQTAGTRQAALTVKSNTDLFSVPLEGVGTAPALAVGEERVDFGSSPVGRTSEARTLRLRNSGSAPLEIGRLGLEGAGARAFSWVSNGCSQQTVAVGADCSVRLAFRPRNSGRAEASLAIESDAEDAPTVELVGLGVAPGLNFDRSELVFDDQRAGERSSAAQIRLENTGNASLSIERLELVGAGRAVFRLLEEDCTSRSIEAGQGCSATLAFEPQRGGRFRAGLRVRSAGLRERKELTLQGRGLAPAARLSSTELGFGSVMEADRAGATVELQSAGSLPLAVSEVRIEGPGASEFTVEEDGCGGRSLTPGANCAVRVVFSPRQTGRRAAELVLRHAAEGAPARVALRGTGVARPVAGISVSESQMAFGSVEVGRRSEIRSLRVASDGNARLVLEDIRVVGDHAEDFLVVPASCNGVPFLVPGSDCVVGFRFAPTTVGERRARVVVRHNAPGGTLNVNLTGRAEPVEERR